jgi:hypothetical protein
MVNDSRLLQGSLDDTKERVRGIQRLPILIRSITDKQYLKYLWWPRRSTMRLVAPFLHLMIVIDKQRTSSDIPRA